MYPFFLIVFRPVKRQVQILNRNNYLFCHLTQMAGDVFATKRVAFSREGVTGHLNQQPAHRAF